MKHFTLVPVKLFEQPIDLIELLLELYQYHAHGMGWKGVTLNEELLSAKSVELEEEVMLVSSLSFSSERHRLIRAIDLIIYSYLCYIAHQNKSSVIKIDVGDISRKVLIKKTQVRISINNLIRDDLLYPKEKSGYYFMGELEYS